MSSVLKRVAAGIGANTFGQAITIGIQLGSLPVFLRYWTISQYGLWLLISAVPSYFSMADVGMVTAAGHKMTMALGRGDAVEANCIFQSAFVFMLITCGAVALLSLPALLLVPLPELTSLDERVALCALILGTLLSLFGGLSESIFRATGRYGFGTSVANLTRVTEWAGYIVGLMMYGSLSAVAIGGLCGRVLGLAALIALSADGKFGIRWQFAAARWQEVVAISKPAFAFMLFPLSNALSFQGMTLLAGYELGPVVVVLFNTYRTIARIAVQATTVLGYSLEPEFSRAYGRAGPTGVASLYRRSAVLGALVPIGLSGALYVAGPWLLKLWTHGKIAFDSRLLLLMLIYAAVAGAWNVPRNLIQSINQHSLLALWSVVMAGLSLLLGDVLCRTWAVDGLAAAMILSEVAIAAICVHLARLALRVRTVAQTMTNTVVS